MGLFLQKRFFQNSTWTIRSLTTGSRSKKRKGNFKILPASLSYLLLCQTLEALRLNCSRDEISWLCWVVKWWWLAGIGQRGTGGLTFLNTLSVFLYFTLPSEVFVPAISQPFWGHIRQVRLFFVGISLYIYLVASFCTWVLPLMVKAVIQAPYLLGKREKGGWAK